MVVGGTGLYIRTLTEGLLAAPAGRAAAAPGAAGKLEAPRGEGLFIGYCRKPTLNWRPGSIPGTRFGSCGLWRSFPDRPHPFCTAGRARLSRASLSPSENRPCSRSGGTLSAHRSARRRGCWLPGWSKRSRDLLDRGFSPSQKALQTIGYREWILHLQGKSVLAEAASRIQRDTRRYAKRQLTWFRKDKSIIWVDSFRESAKIQALIEYFYAS